ncbi:MAG: biotin--[acetyl-CoA-carboxylase] ligase [Sedimentisphaerales bacterium]|nr:biotin--[acetyl-CoA-carboxylase] ligase [Sedimentisphaerales bacterium]
MEKGSGPSDPARDQRLILDVLQRHRNQWLSLEALRIALGAGSCEAVHTLIHALQQRGHHIAGMPQRGYRLEKLAENLSAEWLENGLSCRRIGRRILVYQITDSTNDVAWQYASEPQADGLAVFAEQQRRGRGRLGRTWQAPPRSSILCSVLLQHAATAPAALTLLAGLATARALETLLHRRLEISWPNDVMAQGRKIAGTLVESRYISSNKMYVLGIGINCRQEEQDFPAEWRGRAVSCRQICRQDVDRVPLAQELLGQLDCWIEIAEQGGLEQIHEEWAGRCADIGRRIEVLSDQQRLAGRVIDVGVETGLVLQLDQGPIRVLDAATTTIIKPA